MREQVHEQEECLLAFDVSDDALEKAAAQPAAARNPTVPSAIICIPFEPAA